MGEKKRPRQNLWNFYKVNWQKNFFPKNLLKFSTFVKTIYLYQMENKKPNIIQEAVPSIENRSYNLYQSGDYGGWVSPDNKLYTFGEHHYDFLASLLKTNLGDKRLTSAIEDGWVRINLPNNGRTELDITAGSKERMMEALKLLSDYIFLRASEVILHWKGESWLIFILPRDKNRLLYFMETGEKVEDDSYDIRGTIREAIDQLFKENNLL